MFLTLMRKDFRVLRAPIVVAMLVFFFLEVFVGIGSAIAESRQLAAMHVPYEPLYVWRAVAFRAMTTLGLCCAFAAVFAGAGMPVERRERWADFAAMLPVSRARQTFARLSAVVLLATVSFGVHAAIVVFANARLPPISTNFSRGWRLVENREIFDVLPFAIAMCGVAWLGAAVLRSPAINVAIAIGVVFGSYVLVGELAEVNRRDEAYHGWNVVLTVVGLIAIVVGTTIASRRVEP